MPQPTPAWYDEQYNNRARIPEHPAILRGWADASAHALANLHGALDVPYGVDPSEKLDIFPALRGSGAAPVFVYLHGGYWRALDKRDQTFIAPAFVEAGATVVLANYALCPAVSIEHIVLQTVRALVWVYRHISGHGGDPARIVVSGHSAGGHLAAMMLACEWQQVAPDLPVDLVKAALAISGLFELEPLRHAPFLAPDLKLSAASARKLSPALMPAPRGGQLAAVVGGDESEEFRRQNTLIARAWGPELVTCCEALPGRNHMNILRELVDMDARLHSIARELLGLPITPAAAAA